MKRYATLARRPKALDDDWDERLSPMTSITVVEPHRERPQETGLLDHLGNELFRMPDEPRPAGFLAKWEEET